MWELVIEESQTHTQQYAGLARQIGLFNFLDTFAHCIEPGHFLERHNAEEHTLAADKFLPANINLGILLLDQFLLFIKH